MEAKKARLVRERQAPLREHYRSTPADAWIVDGAQTEDACGEDPFHGRVVPANSADAPMRFGIHRAIGGFHDLPNPGDLLSAALAACLDSTLRMVAEHLAIGLESLQVTVESECDVRGCLQVERSVRVGFQRMRCRVRLQPKTGVDEKQVAMLLAAAEQCCVVLQTLRNGVDVQARLESAATAEADITA